MQKIQAVFVDCDGVLYDADLLAYENFVTACRKAGSELGLDWSDFDIVHDNLKKQGFRGFYNTVLKLCQQQSIPFEKVTKRMTEILDYSLIKPNQKLLKLLQKVALKRKLYIFTNNTKMHLEKIFNCLFSCTLEKSKLKAITVENTLDGGYFFTKCMSGVFTKWCKKLDFPPSETLILDDSDDVLKAAKEDGLHFIKIEKANMTEKILKELI